MLVGFFKGRPTDHIIRYVGGNVVAEGPGLAFYFLKHKTSIAAVPTASTDADFVFHETTGNFQEVAIQGRFTYRVGEPRRLAELLNFTIDPGRYAYLADGPERLPQRITNVVQMATRSEVQRRSLEDALKDSQAMASEVSRQVREGQVLEQMGVELMDVYFLAVRPTPEVAKALEAEYREALLRRADEATFARRAAAVEMERKIKENELNTDIAMEQQRQSLIALAGENAQREAESRGKALELEASYRARAMATELGPFEQMEPRRLLALALKDMAAKVGNVTITSEILASILNELPTFTGRE